MGVPDALGTEGTYTFYTSAQGTNTDTGGRVVSAPYDLSQELFLYGPRRQTLTAGIEQTKVPFILTLHPEGNSVTIKVKDGAECTLAQGAWSDWQPVTFSLGLFKKMKGMVKFYLVETKPELKLYASPIDPAT